MAAGPESIDFYVTGSTDEGARERLACRLAEKAFRHGRRVFVAAASAADASRLDDLLWTFQQGSFVPHAIAGQAGDDEDHPVLIGTGSAPATHRDVLIVLRSDVPPEYRHFRRVIEIVPGEPGGRSQARARFRYYREQGAEPNTHEVDTG